MKLFVLFISLLLFHTDCNRVTPYQEAMQLDYLITSRGIYRHISITEKSISTQNKRFGDTIHKKCPAKAWESITSIIKTLSLESLDDLEPPSKKHQVDRAALATLTIQYKGKVYQTEGFDHGNPPEAIAKLVKEILSISENIE
ncbi:hypothetical protein [Aestuariivivens sediminicola]|uniref:hypothetical protein n=1 Tax=Aestuariivivens sediminicola TaxID=2913560 RepID=UPI001F5A8FA0|nr:hypothetical protein [Aestuariivivens sediminicola]